MNAPAAVAKLTALSLENVSVNSVASRIRQACHGDHTAACRAVIRELTRRLVWLSCGAAHRIDLHVGAIIHEAPSGVQRDRDGRRGATNARDTTGHVVLARDQVRTGSLCAGCRCGNAAV